MEKKDLRIVYMGTPEFAVESLKRLVEGGYNVERAFPSPPSPLTLSEPFHKKQDSTSLVVGGAILFFVKASRLRGFFMGVFFCLVVYGFMVDKNRRRDERCRTSQRLAQRVCSRRSRVRGS